MSNAGYRLVWNADKVLKNIDQKLGRNLDAVGVMLQRKVVESFGSPSALPEGGAVNGRGKKISAKKWRQGQHSKPGDPPFVQTGTLRRSITYERDGLRKLLVGSSLKPQGGSEHSYAFWLEMGGSVRAAHPFLRPALRNNKAAILSILATGKE
jgi:HK97 gp10 family phage protein